MKYFFYLISIILIFAVNVGLFGQLPIAGQIPNLLLLFMLNFAVDKKNLDFFFLAFFGGILMDFYFTGFFGSFTLAFLFCGVFVYSLAGNLFFLEVNWKSLSALLFGSQIILFFTIWLYNLIAFKLSWVSFYVPVNVYADHLFVSFFYNWLLLYPTYIVANKFKDLISSFNLYSRGIVK